MLSYTTFLMYDMISFSTMVRLFQWTVNDVFQETYPSKRLDRRNQGTF